MYKLGQRERNLRQEMRGKYPEGLRWYAVMTHTGMEKRVERFVKEELYDQSISEVLLPILRAFPGPSFLSASPCSGTPNQHPGKALLATRRGGDGISLRLRKEREKEEFLFRSYIFLHCSMTDAIYSAVCNHSNVFQILGRAHRIPSVLDDDEIHCLKQVLDSNANPKLVTRRNIGDRVEIMDGLMAGTQGRVVSANAKEVKLEISFSFLDMGTSVIIAVPRSSIRISKDGPKKSLAERASYAW